MSQFEPLPEAARFVAQKIREFVPRPATLPTIEGDDGEGAGSLRWMVPDLEPDEFDNGRDVSYPCETCPLGLIPCAMDPLPMVASLVPVEGFDDVNVSAFWSWWDVQRDAQKAVDAVWGTP